MLIIALDDAPDILESEESSPGVALSTVDPFTLRQFQVGKFVECKGEERGSTTPSLIGLPTDKMEDNIQDVRRKHSPVHISTDCPRTCGP